MADIRVTLDEMLDGLGKENLKALIDEALDAEKLKWSFCPNCSKKVQVEVPDIAARSKALATLIDQAKGKPAEIKKVTVNAHVRALRDMTDEELEEIVAAGENGRSIEA